MALLEEGTKVYVVRRRGFDGDLRRHFLGEVVAVEGTTVRLFGYAFLYDTGSTSYVRHDEPRTTFVDVGQAGFIVNVVDPQTDIENTRYEVDDRGRLIVTDGGALRLDVNEFGILR